MSDPDALIGVRITITAELTELWCDRATADELTDAELIALVHEDLLALLDEATWLVERRP